MKSYSILRYTEIRRAVHDPQNVTINSSRGKNKSVQTKPDKRMRDEDALVQRQTWPFRRVLSSRQP